MTKILWSLLLTLPLLAQDAAPKQEEKQEEKKEEKKAENPSPAVESALSGMFDIGVRYMTKVNGDNATYRSVVNNAEGFRLANLELTYKPLKPNVIDEAHLDAHNWGDPYNTARFSVGKRGLWDYSGRYSDLFYYNALPSFANLNTAGLYAGDMRAYDTKVRDFDNEMRYLPGKMFSPYIGMRRNSSQGSGVMPLILDGNEYPLRNLVDWKQTDLFGGVRVEMRRFHATVEQGAMWFNDDQQVYSTAALAGDRITPVLGKTQLLTSGQEIYRIDGGGTYTKVLATASMTRWLDLTGQWVRSRPEVTSNYSEVAAGTLYSPSQFALISGQTDTLYGNANQPHTSAVLGGEARFGRVQVRESWDLDRYQAAATADLTSLLTGQNGVAPVSTTLNSSDLLDVKNRQWRTDVLIDAAKWLTIRMGYRYDWGDAKLRGGITSQDPVETASMQRHVALMGFTMRPTAKLSWTADMEVANSPETIFRTSLADYLRLRSQVRYQVRDNLALNGGFSLLQNQNTASNLSFDARQSSAGVQWMPKGGKKFTVLADYTRSTLTSDTTYLVPIAMTLNQSLYRDNAHTGTLLVDMMLGGVHAPRLTAGGSFVTTAGTRPSRYWQPLGKLYLPLNRMVQVYAEWRWYGFRQPLFLNEGFQNHQIQSGIRFTL